MVRVVEGVRGKQGATAARMYAGLKIAGRPVLYKDYEKSGYLAYPSCVVTCPVSNEVIKQ